MPTMQVNAAEGADFVSDPRHTPEVLIVGAGPTGLMLACELARRGVSFRLIEAAAGPQPGSRGKGLQPRTLEVFDNLGIVGRVMGNGRMAMPMLATGPDGKTVLTGGEPPAARPDIPYPSTLITPEWRVEEALRLHLDALGGSVEFGVSFRALEQSESGVTALLAGNDEATETVHARWLVGCDGGHSLVRKGAGIAFDGETREDVRMIVADAMVDGLGRDAWHVWRSEEGFFALCPLPSTNLFQYQAGIAPGQNAELSLANMQATLERRSGRTDIRLHEPEWKSLWRANIRLAERYRDGRVFLAGDAAHIHSPAGGQGMNTGIQDAQNLGWKLAAVVQGAPVALLDSYEAERRPIAAGVLTLSNKLLHQAITEKDVAFRRTANTTQLDISYRGSELANDDRDDTAALRAGDRAPDATGLKTGDGNKRLFDLTRGQHFTLLNFGPPVPVASRILNLRTLHVVAHRSHADQIEDAEGNLTRAYSALEKTLVLIRPDGYIAIVSDAGDVTVVDDFLRAFDGWADTGG